MSGASTLRKVNSNAARRFIDHEHAPRRAQPRSVVAGRCKTRIGIAGAFIFLIVAALARPVHAESVVSIEVIRADGERRELAPGPEQRVATDARSVAVIRYYDGSVVYVAPGSVVRVGSIFVEFGEIFARARGLFRVDTQFVTAAVEGTEYSVRVRPRNDVTVVVLQGGVRCISKKIQWPEFVLSAGEIAFFEAQEFPRADRASDSEIASLKRRLAQLERIASPP